MVNYGNSFPNKKKPPEPASLGMVLRGSKILKI
jgi:hypothetical protein